jgi:hypothetical protein
MIIRSRKNWKDVVEQKPHNSWTRRDFLSRGLATSVATVTLPHALMAAMTKSAFASSTSCPPQVRTPGALAQIYRDGGPCVGAMFINETQAGFMSAAVAADYGIVQTDVTKVGSNYYLAKSSPFGLGIMTPPSGYTQASWNAILMQTSLGGHYGAFNQDDGAGENSGLLGGSAVFKPSILGKDLRINNQATLANWAQGIPSTGVRGNTTNLTPALVAGNFAIQPSAGVTSQLVTNAAQAADSLSSLFMGLFGPGRTQAQNAVSNAVCGFYGDSVLADSTYGNSLFNPTAISALSSAITLGNLTAEEQALLAAYYQSATGSIGGVFVQQNGNDYHPNNATGAQIAATDYEAGRMVAMFIAACQVAGTKGAMIILHNGRASANNTQAETVGPQNNMNVMSPVAVGDAGGSYNAGFIVAYDPSSAPALQTTGTFNTSSGNVTAASAVASSNDAVAGLYLTAVAHLGMNVTTAANKMVAAGVSSASTPSNIMLIS